MFVQNQRGMIARTLSVMVLLSAAPASVVLAADATDQALRALAGEWQMVGQPAGCTDQQETVKIGRQTIEFHESTCDLSNGQMVGSTLIFDATCDGEGETWPDRIVLTPHSRLRLKLSSESNGEHELVRCSH